MSWRIGITQEEYDREMARISYLTRKRVFNDLPELYENSLKASDNYCLTRDLLIEELKEKMCVHGVINEHELLADNFYLSILDELFTDNKYIYFTEFAEGETRIRRRLRRFYCFKNGKIVDNWIDGLFDFVVDVKNWTENDKEEK